MLNIKEIRELDNKEFVQINLDVSNIGSKEELIEKINELRIDEDKYYKIILVGTKNKSDIAIRNLVIEVTHRNIKVTVSYFYIFLC